MAKKDEKKVAETAVAVVHENTPAPYENSAEALIAQAIEKGTSVDTMERLLAMRRELKSEWSKEQYDKAMAAFQASCPTIKKTREVKTDGGKVAYRYAPIESIVYQVKDALKANGFSYTTGMELKDEAVRVTVRVTHQAGHSEETSMEVPFGSQTKVMSKSQVAAAATTFAKRYAFCNAFGILTGDEDTDARPLDTDAPKGATSQFEKAKRMIQTIKDPSGLIEYSEKLKGSKLFTDEEKDELQKLISARVDAQA